MIDQIRTAIAALESDPSGKQPHNREYQAGFNAGLLAALRAIESIALPVQAELTDDQIDSLADKRLSIVFEPDEIRQLARDILAASPVQLSDNEKRLDFVFKHGLPYGRVKGYGTQEFSYTQVAPVVWHNAQSEAIDAAIQSYPKGLP